MNIDPSMMTEDIDPRHEALVAAITSIHQEVRSVNNRLAKNAKKHNYITPRDYLDFIKHFIDILNEKKEELEEQ